jgi:hypothetical protein
MLVLEDLIDFSTMDLTLHLNSMIRVCGGFEEMDSTAHDTSRLECGYVIEEFQPLTRTDSSESVRTCL